MSQGVAVCNCLPKTAWPPTSAAGTGCSAALDAERYLTALEEVSEHKAEIAEAVAAP